jgi:6-pyruvoyltetrahydropterin/6-carboxytetrahydropterin synthase
MYEVKILSHFAAAHQLRGFRGACEQLHGHNWKVEVSLAGERLGEDGMLIDFQVVKDATKRALEKVDHRFLNELGPFQKVNPSSENIARFLFDTLSGALNRPGLRVTRVVAWESDSACAVYTES